MCPGIIRQPIPDARLALGPDDQQCRLSLANHSAENDKALLEERFHEARMLIPLLLLAHGKRVIPVLAMISDDRVIVLGSMDKYAMRPIRQGNPDGVNYDTRYPIAKGVWDYFAQNVVGAIHVGVQAAPIVSAK
jgi:hypothetical protein